MKKNMGVTPPMFFVSVAVMLAMAFITWFWNRNLAYVEVLAVLIIAFAVHMKLKDFKSYIKNSVKNSLKSLDSIDKNLLDSFYIPVVVIDKSGNIILSNYHFDEVVTFGDSLIGDNISTVIKNETISRLLTRRGTDISYKGKRYTVFGVPAGKEAYILYFIEDTYYKEVSVEYVESRPVVALIMFDNKEELERENVDTQDSEVGALVENILKQWARTTRGIFKKLTNVKYMLVMEERDVKDFIFEKFKVLEDVRNIKVDERHWATISVGIGRGAGSLREAEIWAKKALDMALGRGGDQVAVNQGESYEFFGGVSPGTERRSKVRARVIASTLIEHVKSSDCIIVMGHKYSDLDSVGASIGMCSTISNQYKKPSYVVVDKKQTLALPLIENIESSGNKMFISPDQVKNLVTDKTLLIIVDTHSQNFLESPDIYSRCKRVVVIDHHRMMVNHISDAVVFYHEPYASSASEMVAELIQYLGESSLSRIEAESLLAGIMLDTKNFVLKTGVRTFEAAAFLRRMGADTVDVKRLFSNSIDNYKVKYQLVSGAEIFNNCAIVCSDESLGSSRVACAQAADELLEIQGVHASFVIYPSIGAVNISARSLGEVNVQLIMEAMGGGGHQTMAGTQIQGGTVAQARDRLIEIISNLQIEDQKE